MGLALLCSSRIGGAQGSAPVQLAWQAPGNCPQEARVRQKLQDLLGAGAGEAAPSRLRAEGTIEAIGGQYRLTLNIHYDLVNATRVVRARSCEDLGGVAAVTLALLLRTEHSSSAPLTARDLVGTQAAVNGANRATGDAGERAATDTSNAKPEDGAPATRPVTEKTAIEESHASPSHSAAHTPWQFAFRVPELRADIGVLPDPGYGIGLAAGLRYQAWQFLVSGTLWLAQDYESGSLLGYGAHFGRLSGELSACRGWRFSKFELAPCALVSLDDVSARGTGIGIVSTNPRTAWVSLGAGLQGSWALSRNAAVVFGVHGRIATSRPRFVSAGVGDNEGEVAQVAPAALGAVLGCEWLL